MRRIGLIARADSRGLGLQTWDFYRHMHPAKVVVIDMGNLTPYVMRLDRFTDAPVVPMDQLCDVMDEFLDGLDVVYSAETPYCFDLLVRARERGVRTVVHVNFEFCRWIPDPDLPKPDLFLVPSMWHFDHVPEPKAYLPFPVDRKRFPYRHREQVETLLHIAGHQAMLDRNGTRLLLTALRYVKKPMNIVVRSQSPIVLRTLGPFPRHVNVEAIVEDVEDNRDLYTKGDVLLAPRRYGGQSLPMNEAMSLGMPVLTLDVEPQRSFLPPECLVPAYVRQRFKSQGGPLESYTCTPRVLAQSIERFVSDPELVSMLSKKADEYADSISWETLKPRFMSLLSSEPRLPEPP